MPTTLIWHWTVETVMSGAAETNGRIDGTDTWMEEFKGTPEEADGSIYKRHGPANSISVEVESTTYHYSRFAITIMR